MFYFISIAILFIAFVISYRYNAKARRKRLIEKLDWEWGKPKTEFFNFHQIGKYASLPHGKSFHKLSEQTIFDIDFYEVFRFIDRTTSRIGQQYLFKKVSQPDNDPGALHNLNASAEYFTNNSIPRKEIQGYLSTLNSNDAYHISSLLQKKSLTKPPWFKFIIIGMVLAVICLGLSFVYPVFLILLIVPVSINMLIHYWNKGNLFTIYSRFRSSAF